MKSPLSTLTLSALILLGCCLFALLVPAFIPFRTNAQNPPCENPSTVGQSYAWAQNSTVTVVIDSSMFSEAQFNCLQTAFNNWNNSKGTNRCTATL